MMALQQVDHLVEEDIFEAFAWFLCEIGVQPDATINESIFNGHLTARPAQLNPLIPKYSNLTCPWIMAFGG
jgi:hypothetical protein